MSSSLANRGTILTVLAIFAGGAQMAVTPVVQASESTASGPEWTLSGMVNYVDDDTGRNTVNGYGGHVGFGTGFMNRHAFEIAAQFAKLNNTDTNPQMSQWSGTLDYRYRVGSSSFFKPYVLGSLGYIRNRFEDDSLGRNKGLIAALGVGIVAPVNRRIAVRGEVRYRVDKSDEQQNYSDWILSAGLEFALTKQHPVAADNDRDGVPDGEDRCEDTPSGTQVDRFGCATARDSDADGVPDSMDMCADTPAGEPTDRFGCREVVEPSPADQRT